MNTMKRERHLPTLLPAMVTALMGLSFEASAANNNCKCSIPYKPSFTIALRPYVGFDAGIRYLDFQREFGRGLFIKRVPQTNLYLGLKFHENFSIDAGWESTQVKSKAINLKPGDQALGFTKAIDDREGHFFKWKLSGWHINLVGHTVTISDRYPLSFFGSVGMGWKKIFVEDILHSIDESPLSDAGYRQNKRTFFETKAILRTTVGTRYMFNSNFGARFYLGWENTNQFFKLKSKEFPDGITQASLCNSIFLGLGLHYQF